MSNLTVEGLNPDRHLSVVIATTFAIAVSHLHNDKTLRDCLTKVLQRNHYSCDELRANYRSALDASAAYSLAPINTNASVYSAVAIAADAFSATHTNSIAAISYAASATDKLRFRHDNLKCLLPIIMKYKINKSKRPFKCPEKILSLLEGKDKLQFLFNLDILNA